MLYIPQDSCLSTAVLPIDCWLSLQGGQHDGLRVHQETGGTCTGCAAGKMRHKWQDQLSQHLLSMHSLRLADWFAVPPSRASESLAG